LGHSDVSDRSERNRAATAQSRIPHPVWVSLCGT